jgi:hypothetical protein
VRQVRPVPRTVEMLRNEVADVRVIARGQAWSEQWVETVDFERRAGLRRETRTIGQLSRRTDDAGAEPAK